MSMPTQITVYPYSGPKLAGEKVHKASQPTAFFGEDGFGIEDVAEAINPLQHIPFVSNLYEQATGNKASVGSKLIGGALIGGPVGFMASLFNVIFEQETGHDVGGSVIAALTGEESDRTTQLAQSVAPEDTNTVQAVPAEAVEMAALTPSTALTASTLEAQRYAALGQATQASIASEISLKTRASQAGMSKDQATLDLFGLDRRSAHESYRKAQFIPYLKDVSSSLVM